MTDSISRKYILPLLLLLLCLTGCDRRSQSTAPKNAMHIDQLLPTTPVKDQGRSALCWDYAILATIETEHLVRGDSVNLSPDYLARRYVEEQARECFFAKGQKAVLLRGMGSTALNLIGRYGAVPYDAYHNYEGVNYNAVARKAMSVARSAASLEQMNNHLTTVLDDAIAYLPTHIYMLGAEYTPLEFAHSVCLPGEYESLTSVTHHPFGSRFVLESPDNHYRDSYLNVPIDTLMSLITRTLRRGHPVCWEGDISEKGFSFAKGMATLGSSERTVTQAERQRELERHQTTDDHAMELCGLAHDRRGRRFFIAKNSWGTDNPFGGFMFLSYDYVKLKTIAVFLALHDL
jgi:hypothetical protein